jgi:hypothetical protein
MAAAAGFLEERQVAEGALVLAVDEDFLGVDGADDAGGVGQGLVGEGEAVGGEAGEAEAVVEFFVFLDSAADVEGEDEEAALFAVDGSGELLDEVDLGGTDGLEVGGVFADEALEGAGGLDGGEEGVERGVCDGGLGGVGFGAAGFCAIAAGGFVLGGGALAFGLWKIEFGHKCARCPQNKRRQARVESGAFGSCWIGGGNVFRVGVTGF